MTNLSPIINALILVLSAILTAFVIPWVRSKYDTSELENLRIWTAIAVSAAEQLYDQCDGAKKRQYVLKFLENHGYMIDDTTVNALEAAVLKLHNELYGTSRVPEFMEDDLK